MPAAADGGQLVGAVDKPWAVAGGWRGHHARRPTGSRIPPGAPTRESMARIFVFIRQREYSSVKKSLPIDGVALLAMLESQTLDPLTRARVFTGVFFSGVMDHTLPLAEIPTALLGLFSKKRGVGVLGVLAAVVAVPVALAASWNANVCLRDTVAVVSAEDELLPETDLRAVPGCRSAG